MFERNIRPKDVNERLGLKSKDKRPKGIADAMNEGAPGFGGTNRFNMYNEKELEVISYVLRKMGDDKLTLEQAVDKAINLFYRQTVLVFG